MHAMVNEPAHKLQPALFMSEAAPKNEPIWTSVPAPKFSKLADDASVDVAIVGAGIAGVTTAYLLAREGRSVLLLDDGPVGGGMSSVTTAHLANALDDRYLRVEKLRGEDGAGVAILVADEYVSVVRHAVSVHCQRAPKEFHPVQRLQSVTS